MSSSAVGLLLASALLVGGFRVHANDAVPRTRAYTLDDYFVREKLVSVSLSPNGQWLAIERRRAAIVGESYVALTALAGDFFSRRSDIYVLNAHDGVVIWRTEGQITHETSFAPSWSPDGKKLAFLQSQHDGRTTLSILSLETRTASQIQAIDVDFSVPISNGSAVGGDGSSAFFTWSSDSRLFVVGRGDLPAQPLGERMLDDLGQRRRSTWQGHPSLRAWDSGDLVLCGRGSHLFEVASDLKGVVSLFEGVIYGVSVAPNGEHIAVVAGQEGLSKPGPMPMLAPEQMRVANRNDLGYWQVVSIDRTSRHATSRGIVSGSGTIVRQTLPRWSENGERLAIVTGNQVQSPEVHAALVIDFVRGTKNVKYTQSLTDAETLASLFALTGLDHLDAAPRRRSVRKLLGGEQREVGVFALGSERAVVSDGSVLKVVDRQGAEEVIQRATSVIGSAHGRSGRELYVRSLDGIGYIADVGGALHSALVTRSRIEGTFVGRTDVGNVISQEDTEYGSFIWSTSESGERTALVRMNEHMASIRVPDHISVRYTVRGEAREGILYLPTVQRFGSRPPVVVTAYPSPAPWAPQLESFAGKVNSSLAWHWHPMLAAGFAVFFVDFRRAQLVDAHSKEYIETPDLVVGEVMPAIAALQSLSEVDGLNLGFAGYSYGGYTALTLLGRTHAFRAIAAESALSNLAQNLSVGPELHLRDCAPTVALSGPFWELEDPAGFIRLGGPFYSEPARMVKFSPLYNLQSARTPTLLFAGELDVWAAGQEAVYMALLRKGVPSKLIMYYGESHNFESPGNIRNMIDEEIAWFTRYLAPLGVAPEHSQLQTQRLR